MSESEREKEGEKTPVLNFPTCLAWRDLSTDVLGVLTAVSGALVLLGLGPSASHAWLVTHTCCLIRSY